jgi:hypothetical protein
VQVNAFISIWPRKSVFHIAFYIQFQLPELNPDLMMAARVQLNFKQVIIIDAGNMAIS